ncbi:hypothetical protein [Agaribacterium sp. ZY112]|uniref:hypothetical protein n=1 Tax=Agaribacterium sp. ZY112 TaxID=3233574 RepID=UPI00352478B7
MSDYSLKFSARLRNGFEAEQARLALIKLFKLNDERADKLITGSPRILKNDLTKPQAHKWVKALWSAGWHSSLIKADKEVYTTVEAKESKLAVGRSDADVAPTQGKQLEKPSVGPAKKAHIQRIYAPRVPASMCILKGWQQQNTLNPNACIQAGCQDRDAYMIVIAQPKKDIEGSPDLKAYTKAVIESAAGFIAQGRISTPIAKQAHRELDCLSAEITGLVDQSNVHYLISVFEGLDHFYAVYFWTSKHNFQQVRPLFNAMNASFSCTKTRKQEMLSEAELTH